MRDALIGEGMTGTDVVKQGIMGVTDVYAGAADLLSLIDSMRPKKDSPHEQIENKIRGFLGEGASKKIPYISKGAEYTKGFFDAADKG